MLAEQTSLDGLIADSIRNALNSDAIKQRVEAAADKAISEAISDAFGYSSAFRKGISECMKSVLPIPSAGDLAEFAHATREILQRRLSTLASETARVHLEEVIEKILPDAPIITLAELKEAYLDKIKRDVPESCDCHGEYEPEYTWEIERDRSAISSLSKYWDLYFAPEEGASRYGSKTQSLRFKPNSENPLLDDCWNVSGFEEGMSKTRMFVGPLNGFDLMVWRLAVGTAKLQQKS